MRSSDSRERLMFPGLKGKSDPNLHVGKRHAIVLIERRPLTRWCLTKWLQDRPPDLHLVSVGSPVDLLEASRSPSDPHTIIFSIGADSVRDPDVLGKITLLQRHMSRIPLVLLSDRDDIDGIIEAMERGVRGYIPPASSPRRSRPRCNVWRRAVPSCPPAP